MPWKESDTMSLKKSFVLRAVSGRESMSDLCREFGISRKTGHKWRERFIAYGFAGLEDQSRRPQTCPNALDEDRICRLIRLRQAHPHWGPRKLAELWRRSYDDSVPSESTFKRVLNKAGLMNKRKRRTRLEGVRIQQPAFQPKAPNEVWTVDFKGWWLCKEKGRCEPLTVRDAFSRYIICALPLKDTKTETVREAFETLFKRYGLPRVIRSDNGSPFASKNAPLGLTRLSAWWISLGISLDRIDPGRPDQNGAHERMHRDIALEVEANAQRSHHENTQTLELWRKTYNEQRPHEAIAMKCPRELYRDSPRKYPATPHDIDYPEGYIIRSVHKRLGDIKIQRKRIFITTTLGGWSIGLKPINEEELSVWFGALELGTLNIKTESFTGARAPVNEPTLDPKTVTTNL